MRLRHATAALVVLAGTTLLAQQQPTAAAPAGTPLVSRRALARRRMSSTAGSPATTAQIPITLRQRMEEMQGTLAKMHAVLKQMRDKAVNGPVKDPLSTANLDMWDLMLGHLDKQFEDLRATTLAQEELVARRAALYKQADAKAQAEAQAAQSSAAGQPPPPAAQGAGQTTAGQTTVSGPTSTQPANPGPSQK